MTSAMKGSFHFPILEGNQCCHLLGTPGRNICHLASFGEKPPPRTPGPESTRGGKCFMATAGDSGLQLSRDSAMLVEASLHTKEASSNGRCSSSSEHQTWNLKVNVSIRNSDVKMKLSCFHHWLNGMIFCIVWLCWFIFSASPHRQAGLTPQGLLGWGRHNSFLST